ncbi:MAG: hypothetical protein ACLQBX_12995 [Candidatus Limnocylindrales bacterium]
MSHQPALMTSLPVCLQCGVAATSAGGTFCRRCGLPYGAPPRAYMAPTCPICYRDAAADGRFESVVSGQGRVDLVRHMAEHTQAPVGDDEYLESLREGESVRVGRWMAPFELVRRYLVLGVFDAGRSRRVLHNALVLAMGQVARWGPDAVVVGDQPEWAEARQALAHLMERYHRIPAPLRSAR